MTVIESALGSRRGRGWFYEFTVGLVLGMSRVESAIEDGATGVEDHCTGYRGHR